MYSEKQVSLYEAYYPIMELWDWLIKVKEEEIIALPIKPNGAEKFDKDHPVEEIVSCIPARTLMGFWLTESQTTASRYPLSLSRGGNWTQRKKEMIASQLKHIRHWKVQHLSFENIVNVKATWFCLPPHQTIRLEDESMIPIKDITVGEKLYGNRIVLNKFEKHFSGNLIKLKIQGLPNWIEMTEDHKIIRIPRPYKRQETRRNNILWDSRNIVRAKELIKNDYVLVPIGGNEKDIDLYCPDQNNNRKKIKPKKCIEFFKILGYYAAEGHIIKQHSESTKYGITFTFNKNEQVYHNDVLKCIKESFGIDGKFRNIPPNDSVVQIEVFSKCIGEIISHYITGTAIDKELHPDLMSCSLVYQKAILQSWLKGDGGISFGSRNRVKLTGTSASKKLAEQMFIIALRLGLKPSFKMRKSKLNGKQFVAYDVYFSSECIKRLGYDIISKSRSSRKIINNCILARIRDIKREVYCGSVYDIHVSNDNLFVANYVLVHNCDPPYEKAGSRYRFNRIDYSALAQWCKERNGQVIVCEQDNATWLPFEHLRFGRNASNKDYKELVWYKDVEGSNNILEPEEIW